MKTISLYTNAPALSNDMAEVLRLFYGNITLLVNKPGGDWTVTHEERIENNIRIVRVYDSNSAYETSETLTGDAINDKRLRRRQAKLGVYRLLKERTGITPPWGSLTGIRPTRLVYTEMDKGCTLDEHHGMVVPQVHVFLDGRLPGTVDQGHHAQGKPE